MIKHCQTKKLGEVCKIQGGFAFKSSDYKTEGIPLVRIQNLQEDLIDITKAVYISKNNDQLKNFLLKEDNILIAMSGATTGKMAKVKNSDLPLLLNQRVGRFITKHDLLDNSYLWYFLKSVNDIFLEQAYGGAQPNISPTKIENLEILIPPLKNQKEIVAKLDQKMAKIKEARKLREEALVDTEKILSQTLHEIFDEGKQNGWEEKQIKDICEINPTKSEIKNISDSEFISFVPMSSVNEYSQSIESQEDRQLKLVRKGYTYFRKDDVIFAKITPCMENGKVAHTKNLNHEIGFGSTEFHVLRADKKLVLPEFIYEIVRSKKFRLEAEQRMTGSAGQKRVPKDFIENYKIKLPPLKEQQKIVKQLDDLNEKVRKVIGLQKSQLEDLKKLEKSYLREAFNGELI